jgi:hypothetical protein
MNLASGPQSGNIGESKLRAFSEGLISSFLPTLIFCLRLYTGHRGPIEPTRNSFLFVGPESEEEYEYSQSYTHGGLWPVKLGDSFGPDGTRRYRIIFKLGYGSFSTRDRVERSDVLPRETSSWISSVIVEMMP